LKAGDFLEAAAGETALLTGWRTAATMNKLVETISNQPPFVIDLTAVIVAITDEQPRVLTVPREVAAVSTSRRPRGSNTSPRVDALPSGPLDPSGDRTLELALRRWVRASAGLELGYVEQLYTFGDRFRDPSGRAGGARLVTAAYMALVRESVPASDLFASWRSVYRFFPWEDWRSGRSEVIDHHIAPALRSWIERANDREFRGERQERTAVTFGVDGGVWDEERVLDRYELLFELGAVGEARPAGRRAKHTASNEPLLTVTGREMALDHRRILASALGRIRAKIKYRPVIFELMPETFTLLQLQRAAEALAGRRLHKQNFRRLVEQGGLVEGTGRLQSHTGGRPAELFRFRREVVLERPAPGLGMPGTRR